MSLRPPVSDKDNIAGNKNAPIELVEYGDYQCPHCGVAYPIIKSIQKKMGDKLKFIFRNFPLEEMHPDATDAAVAAEAAAAQGKFWEMHDTIYEHQYNLSDVALVKYAEKIGLDMKKFKEDYEKTETLDKVQNDFESGVRSGVNGTPSFFINGKKYEDSWDEDVFLANLKAMI